MDPWRIPGLTRHPCFDPHVVTPGLEYQQDNCCRVNAIGPISCSLIPLILLILCLFAAVEDLCPFLDIIGQKQMRKLSLLAAAAMVAGGSVFAMDGGGVSISGEANFGVKYDEANDTPTSNALAFHHEFDITFAASGTTDGGIGFGGEVTIDNTESVTQAKTPGKKGLDKYVEGGRLGGENSAANRFIQVSATGKISFVPGSGASGAVQDSDIGAGRFKVPENTDANDLILPVRNEAGVITGFDRFEIGDDDDGNITNAQITALRKLGWVIANEDGSTIAADTEIPAEARLYQIADSKYYLPDNTAASVVTGPKAKSTVDNHAEVYISMDMHKLTIGSDLDAADKTAGGIADPGFDGIGIDDVAEGPYGESAADVRYDGDFGIASVAISYGDNAGDADWAAGFSFNVDPVTFGAGFDSNGVMSIGLGFSQGLISMNALYSTDSDANENDNEAVTDDTKATATSAAGGTTANPARSNAPDIKDQAIGVDMTYQMSEATSLVLVAAQRKTESAEWYYGASAGVPDDLKKAHWVKSSTTVDAFGVGFAHDLGGGATLKAGAGSVDSDAVADLGITMTF